MFSIKIKVCFFAFPFNFDVISFFIYIVPYYLNDKLLQTRLSKICCVEHKNKSVHVLIHCLGQWSIKAASLTVQPTQWLFP
jgi:hypothetical protein